MNEQRIQELKDALRDIMAMIVDRGQPLNDDIRQMLAQVMEHVAERIQALRQEGESSVEGLQPELEPSMASSNINSFAYDDKTGNLMVKFQGDYPQQNGPVYSYGGVPKQIFDLFRSGSVPARTEGKNKWGKWWKGKVPSMGASMFTLIKGGGYPYKKVS